MHAKHPQIKTEKQTKISSHINTIQKWRWIYEMTGYVFVNYLLVNLCNMYRYFGQEWHYWEAKFPSKLNFIVKTLEIWALGDGSHREAVIHRESFHGISSGFIGCNPNELAEWRSGSVSALPCERPGFGPRTRLREIIPANNCTMQGQNNWGNWGSPGAMKLWVAWEVLRWLMKFRELCSGGFHPK